MSQRETSLGSGERVYVGVTLRRVLNLHGPLPVRSATDIALKVSESIAAMHARGETFGKLCPENIWFMLNGEPAMFSGRCYGEWDVERACTIGYPSPEEARSQPITAASDIWTVGCLLYEMLTGTSPHQAAGTISPGMRTFTMVLMPMPIMPVILESTITWSAADRYDSMATLVSVLQSFEVTDAVAEAPPAPAARLRPPSVVTDRVTGELRGVSLRRKLRVNGPLSLTEVSYLFDSIAETIDHLHHEGIRHGAICPDYIWIRLDGTITLYTPAVGADVESRAHMAKIGYLSPEEEAGETPTRAADIYALGMLLFEVLMGDEARPSRAGHAAVPGVLTGTAAAAEHILDEALAENPPDRFSSAQGMANALWLLVPDHAPVSASASEDPEAIDETDAGMHFRQAVQRPLKLTGSKSGATGETAESASADDTPSPAPGRRRPTLNSLTTSLLPRFSGPPKAPG